jgi:hypothetical protein
MTKATVWTMGSACAEGQRLYEEELRFIVETPENIGKMLTVDIETGEYRIDDGGIRNGLELRRERPTAELFTLRIGYDAGACFGGSSDRIQR